VLSDLAEAISELLEAAFEKLGGQLWNTGKWQA